MTGSDRAPPRDGRSVIGDFIVICLRSRRCCCARRWTARRDVIPAILRHRARTALYSRRGNIPRVANMTAPLGPAHDEGDLPRLRCAPPVQLTDCSGCKPASTGSDRLGKATRATVCLLSRWPRRPVAISATRDYSIWNSLSVVLLILMPGSTIRAKLRTGLRRTSACPPSRSFSRRSSLPARAGAARTCAHAHARQPRSVQFVGVANPGPLPT